MDRAAFSAAFSPDRSRVVVVGDWGRAQVWRIADGTHEFTLRGPEERLCHGSSEEVTYVEWWPRAGGTTDKSLIVTASADGTARVWRGDTGDPVRPGGVKRVQNIRTTARDNWEIVWAGLSTDGTVILVAGISTDTGEGTIRMWEVAHDDEPDPVPGGSSQVTIPKKPIAEQAIPGLITARLAPNGEDIVTVAAADDAAADGPATETVALWKFDQTQKTLQHHAVLTLDPRPTLINEIEFAGKSDRIVVATDTALLVYDKPQAKADEASTGNGSGGEATIEQQASPRHETWTSVVQFSVPTAKEPGSVPFYAACFDPTNRNRIATASEDGYVRIWEIGATKNPVARLPETAPTGDRAWLNDVRFDSTGSMVVAASETGTAAIYLPWQGRWSRRSVVGKPLVRTVVEPAQLGMTKDTFYGVVFIHAGANGDLVLANRSNNQVWLARPGKQPERIAGQGGPNFKAAKNPLEATFELDGRPAFIDDRLFFSDGSARIYMITNPGTAGAALEVIAGGTSQEPASVEGQHPTAVPLEPVALVAGEDGALYVACGRHYRVFKITDPGTDTAKISTVAGTGDKLYRVWNPELEEHVAPTESNFDPWDLAFDGDGNLYVCDIAMGRIRRISGLNGDTTPSIQTVAGGGDNPFERSKAVEPLSVWLHPASIAIGPGGSVYITDQVLNGVLCITQPGTADARMRQIAGTGRDSSFEAPVVGAVDPMSIDFTPWGGMAVGRGTIYVNDMKRCSILAIS